MTDNSSTSSENPKIDQSVPHSARVWNYWLGGKDHYPVDRAVGDQVMAMFPDITRLARADRAFLGRAVRYLAGEARIRQFLDIGTGLPTADNTHQVAQAIAPESRIVYVDNDPLVLVHARALGPREPDGGQRQVHRVGAGGHRPGDQDRLDRCGSGSGAGRGPPDGRWRVAMDPGAFAVGAPDMAQLLARSQAPVTLARGEHDPMNTDEQLARLGAPTVTLPGLGHNAHVQSPQLSIALLDPHR